MVPIPLRIVAALVLTSALLQTAKGHETPSEYFVRPVLLPGVTGAVSLDHLAYDPKNRSLWVPGSNTGNVYVINNEVASAIPGFHTGSVELEGQKAKMGPSAAALGEGVTYIGNRADSTLCVVDSRTLKIENCVEVKHRGDVADSGPHAVAFIPLIREVWVTTGPGKSIEVFDASDPKHPNWKTEIVLESSSEGCAVDNKRGLFYTNLNEVERTVAIDVRSRKVVASWNVHTHDVQGIALDTLRGFIFVACNDHLVSLDAKQNDKIIDTIATGAGLDDIAFSTSQKMAYAAASVTATLAMTEVSDDGKFHLKALLPTAKGARGVTIGSNNTPYLIDPINGRILAVISKESHE